MRVTKNRAGVVTAALLVAGLFLVACAPPGPRALLAGKELLDRGNVAAAIQELQTATTMLPTNAAAWNYLGVAYHRAGQWTNAADAYSRALRFNRELLEVRFNLGCLWLDQNQPNEAKAEFTAYILRRPNAVEGWLKLGAAQLQMRDPAAEKSFREALRVNARAVEALNGLGLVFVQRNRPREAVEAFTTAVKLQPDYRPALLNLATVLQQQLQDRAGAVQRYREYLALRPRDENWEAVNAIVRALEPTPVAPVRVPPSNQVVASPGPTNVSRPPASAPPRPVIQPKPEPQSNAIRTPVTVAPVARVVTNHTPPAPEIVKLSPDPVIKTTPDDQPIAPRAVAPSATGTSNLPTTRVAAATPAPPSERRGFFSRLNPFNNEPKPAAESLNVSSPPPAVRQPSDEDRSRYQYSVPTVPKPGDREGAVQALGQGQQAQRADRLSEAIQFYRRATQLDGSFFEAHYALGLATFQTRNFKAAAAAWEMAVAIRPNSSDARYNFALTLKAANHAPEAAQELEKLLALHPDEARAHLTLGNLYAEQLANKTRARQHYQRVLQLDPRNPQAQAIRYWLVANPG